MSEFAFAWLDCEFGGLDPDAHDITEIALVLTDYRLAELASGHWRVRFREERSTPEAREIFGYDPALWADAVSIRQALGEIVALCGSGGAAGEAGEAPRVRDWKVVPAGQNVRMDVMFLERAFAACEIPSPFDYHVIDLASVFYAWSLVAGEAVPALSLRQAATTAGLIDGPVPHRALDDTRLTLETFRHYVGALALRETPAPPPLRPEPTAEADAETTTR